jgi:hypothetical protein
VIYQSGGIPADGLAAWEGMGISRVYHQLPIAVPIPVDQVIDAPRGQYSVHHQSFVFVPHFRSIFLTFHGSYTFLKNYSIT